VAGRFARPAGEQRRGQLAGGDASWLDELLAGHEVQARRLPRADTAAAGAQLRDAALVAEAAPYDGEAVEPDALGAHRTLLDRAVGGAGARSFGVQHAAMPAAHAHPAANRSSRPPRSAIAMSCWTARWRSTSASTAAKISGFQGRPRDGACSSQCRQRRFASA